MDSSDSGLVLNLDVVQIDCIVRTIEERGGIRLGRENYCGNRVTVGNAGIRRTCCRLN